MSISAKWFDLSSMNDLIPCSTPHGQTRLVPRSRLIFRPSVYGLIVHQGKLLVTLSRTTGKWKLPGGGINLGESMEATLVREIFEECGIEVRLGMQVFFKEDFFCFDAPEAAWQAHLFFFFAEPLSLEVTNSNNVTGDESDAPQWVDIASLEPASFQFAGDEIVAAVRRTHA